MGPLWTPNGRSRWDYARAKFILLPTYQPSKIAWIVYILNDAGHFTTRELVGYYGLQSFRDCTFFLIFHFCLLFYLKKKKLTQPEYVLSLESSSFLIEGEPTRAQPFLRKLHTNMYTCDAYWSERNHHRCGAIWLSLADVAGCQHGRNIKA